MRSREPHPPGHFNRLVERTVPEIDGIESLCPDSFLPRDEFECAYGIERYRAH